MAEGLCCCFPEALGVGLGWIRGEGHRSKKVINASVLRLFLFHLQEVQTESVGFTGDAFEVVEQAACVQGWWLE